MTSLRRHSDFHDEDTKESSLASLRTTNTCSLQTVSQIEKRYEGDDNMTAYIL